eukprot:TRINITY_DN22039_c0_g1_i1.p2 TRINITY_DN22039_c0_g1~~TRINITY_DN22039_c0_g1_i1.p2  ORF type:complete len:560 (+),score=265.73 TRINITY_DN22039_c0_g1_i1:76-1755(+)
MSDLASLYSSQCEHADVKANKTLLESLTTEGGDIEAIDLSLNIVGENGMGPVFEVLAAATKLSTLNLANNGLTSAMAKDLCEIMKNHPSITALDVSKNNLPLGGEPFLTLVKGNPRVVELSIDETNIRPLFVKLIEYQVKRNRGERPDNFTAEIEKAVPAAAATEANGNGHEAAAAQPAAAEPDAEGAFGEYTFGACGFGGDDDGDDAAEDPFAGNNDDDDDDEDAFGAAPTERRAQFVDQVDESEHTARMAAMQATGGRRRKTVSSEVISKEEMVQYTPKIVMKPTEDVAFLTKLLEENQLFSHLEDSELALAVNAMEILEAAAGEEMVSEGEDADKFFVIKEGAAVEVNDEGNVVANHNAGDCLGVTDLLYYSQAANTIKVKSDALRAFWLDRSNYRHLVTNSSHNKRKRYMEHLEKISFLKHMSTPEFCQLADSLKTAYYKHGDVIIAHGSEGQWFHIILEGTVEVIGRRNGEEVQVCTFTVGECVGELEFINNHVCVADVKALTPNVKTAKMNRRHFERVMGPCVDILKNVADTSHVYEYYRETQANTPPPESPA